MSVYSKLAKKPIPIPDGVDLRVSDGMVFAECSGNSGLMPLSSDVALKIEDGFFSVLPSKRIKNPAMVGTFTAKLKNLVRDAKTPYKLSLRLIGVGYKAFNVDGKIIAFNVGYSHLIAFQIPDDISCNIKDNTEIECSGFIDSVTSFADDLCKIVPWDPCLQSGIIIKDSFLRKKEGKKK